MFAYVFEDEPDTGGSSAAPSRTASRSNATTISLSARGSGSISRSRSVEQDPPVAAAVCVIDVDASSDSVVDEQPQQADSVPNDKGSDNGFEEEYKDGLFDCWNNIAPSCLMSFFCPCIMAGQIGQKIGSCGFLCVVAIVIILVMGDVFVIGTAGFTTVIVEYLFMAFVVARLRGDMRNSFNLQARHNCLVSTFCMPCSLAQMARQLYDYQSQCSGCICSIDGEEEEEP